MNHTERIAEAAAKRKEDMSEAAKRKLDARLEAADDWYGVCQECGESLQGTLADIRKHTHAKTST